LLTVTIDNLADGDLFQPRALGGELAQRESGNGMANFVDDFQTL